MLPKKQSKTAGVSCCPICRRYYNVAGEFIPKPAEDVVIGQWICDVCFWEAMPLIVENFKAADLPVVSGPEEFKENDRLRYEAAIGAGFYHVSRKYDVVAEDGRPLTRAERRRGERR